MKLFVTMLAACAALSGLAGTTAKGATENWVKVQIANATNAVYTRIAELHTAQTVTNTAGDVETTLETENTKMVIAEADRGALRIDNCTPAAVSVGLTNNMIFAYTADDWRYYVNGHKWIDVISTDATNSVGQKTGVVVTSYALTIGQLALTSRVFGDVYYLCDSVGNKYCSLHGAYITNAEAARLLEYYQPNTGRVAWYDRALDFIGRLLIPSACAAKYEGDFSNPSAQGLLHKKDVDAKLGGSIHAEYIDGDGNYFNVDFQYIASDFWDGDVMVSAQDIRKGISSALTKSMGEKYGEDYSADKLAEVCGAVMNNVGEAAVAKVIAIVTQCRLENVSRQVAKVYNPVEGLKSQPTAAYVNSSKNWTDSGDDPDGTRGGVNGEPYEKSRGSWTYQKINNFLNAITEGDETQLLDNKTLNKTQNGVGDRRWQLYNFDGSLSNPHVAESDLIGLLNENIKNGSGGQGDIGNLQRRVWFVCKTKDGDGNTHLDYIPFAYAERKLNASGVADGITISTNAVDDSESELNGKLGIAGFYKQDSSFVLADELLGEKDNEGALEYCVLVRAKAKDGDLKDAQLYYASLGNLSDMAWSTNWTEAVKNISKDEAKRITDAATNIYFKEENIYNITNIYLKEENINILTNLYLTEEYVNIETNVYHNETFVNFSTNVVIKYGDSITNYYYLIGMPQKGGEKPEVKPEDNPYDPGYEHDEVWDDVLPVKNALNIVAITNTPYEMIAADKLYDEFSIWTNDNGVAEIAGFSTDGVDDPLTFGDNYVPVRRTVETEEGDGYVLVWYEFPWATTNTLDITTNELTQVKEWLKIINEKNIFNVVITNNENFTALTNKFFTKVAAERILDNKSVWTNGAAQVEVKGFAQSGNKTYAVSRNEGGKHIEWAAIPQPDGNTRYDWDVSKNNASLECEDDYGEIGTSNVWHIAGFMDAENDTVPHIKIADNGARTIDWKAAGGGCALKFIGTDNAEIIVGSGSKTNDVMFASATDSNVEVKCTRRGTDGVTVTIGVHYNY